MRLLKQHPSSARSLRLQQPAVLHHQDLRKLLAAISASAACSCLANPPACPRRGSLLLGRRARPPRRTLPIQAASSSVRGMRRWRARCLAALALGLICCCLPRPAAGEDEGPAGERPAPGAATGANETAADAARCLQTLQARMQQTRGPPTQLRSSQVRWPSRRRWQLCRRTSSGSSMRCPAAAPTPPAEPPARPLPPR